MESEVEVRIVVGWGTRTGSANPGIGGSNTSVSNGIGYFSYRGDNAGEDLISVGFDPSTRFPNEIGAATHTWTPANADEYRCQSNPDLPECTYEITTEPGYTVCDLALCLISPLQLYIMFDDEFKLESNGTVCVGFNAFDEYGRYSGDTLPWNASVTGANPTSGSGNLGGGDGRGVFCYNAPNDGLDTITVTVTGCCGTSNGVATRLVGGEVPPDCDLLIDVCDPPPVQLFDITNTDDFGDSPFGTPENQCPIGVCFDLAAPFSDDQLPSQFADPFKGDPSRDWGSSGWSVGLCCSGVQKLEILSSANNGSSGASDCRETPVQNLPPKSDDPCDAGGDVSMGRIFNVNTAGQVYSAAAMVKLLGVRQPQPGMFRARLTIHGYDATGKLQTECNDFLRSTEVDGPDGNPVPGTTDQTLAFLPIKISDCEMVDTFHSDGIQDIRWVDVAVRANDFKNDIAYGTVHVQRITFTRES